MSEEDRIHHSVGGPQANLLHTLPRDYDMDDSQNDLQRWPRLAPILRDCSVTLSAAFRRADSTARRYETIDRLQFYIAAIPLAVVQFSLVLVEMPWWSRVGDFVAAIAAIVAVFALIIRRPGTSRRRLLERERAERCRLLKFSFLISPEAWSDPSDMRQAWLSRRVEDIKALSRQDLIRSAEGEDKAFEATSVGAAARIDEATLDQVVDYYHEKRLHYQLQYFERQFIRRNRWDRFTRHAPTIYFFLGILAALAYFTYNLGIHIYFDPNNHSERDAIGRALLLFAGFFPVLGVTVDQFRKANGFERSVIRFRTASNELKQRASELQTAADARQKLAVLQTVEEFFDEQRRENLTSEIDALSSDLGG